MYSMTDLASPAGSATAHCEAGAKVTVGQRSIVVLESLRSG